MAQPGTEMGGIARRDGRKDHNTPGALLRPKAGYFSLLVVAVFCSRDRKDRCYHAQSQAGQLPTYHKYQNPTFHNSSG